jgi:15-cis-phytoene synthase
MRILSERAIFGPDMTTTTTSNAIPAELANAYASARKICKHHARSFYFASHFLPRPKRDHAYAVYAFCRLLDDAADEEPSIESVTRFEDLLGDVYEGRMVESNEPSMQAFAHTVKACEIPRSYFADLAQGCRMDFDVVKYATWPELEKYCYHVAGVVGLIMCRVFGMHDETALANAVQMGNAMQLTNILRDIREDKVRGRVYVAREDLERFGVSEADLDASSATEGLKQVVKFNIERARGLYTQAARGLRALPDDGSRLTACVMAVVYAGILGAIERQGHDVMFRRARTNLLGKLLRVLKARRLARGQVVRFD